MWRMRRVAGMPWPLFVIVAITFGGLFAFAMVMGAVALIPALVVVAIPAILLGRAYWADKRGAQG